MKGSRQQFEEWSQSAAAAAEEEAAAANLARESGPEADEEADYRRRRAPVRVKRQRGAVAAQWWRRGRKPLAWCALALALGGALYGLLFRSAWFVLAGSNQITISGLSHADSSAVLDVFSGDLGRNVFFIPLEARRASVEALPWVAGAEVLRIWPARIEIRVQERVPVALGRFGDQLRLLDKSGVMLELPAAGAHYDFPVLTGLDPAPGAPPRRRAQVRQYLDFIAALDANGSGQSQNVAEVDLTDPANLKARVTLPGSSPATLLLQLGDHNYGPRYALFQSQIAGWEQKYPDMVSVDLHYDGEAIVDPGVPAAAPVAAKKHP